MKKHILFLLFIPISFTLSSAQTGAPWLYVRPSNTGLGGNFMQCIEVDRCGNKWTGGYIPFFSEGAVSRFDDTTWTTWSNVDGFLPADRVYDVAFDNNNGIWVAVNGVGNGMAHGGISHFDGISWTTYTTANSPLPIDDMRGICVDHNNNVWATFYSTASGQGGVAKFTGTSWTIYTPGNSNLQSGVVDKIDVDAQNNVWIGTNMGLIKFDGLNWILYTSQNSGLSNNDVTDVEYDETTDRIFAATGIAIDIFDGITWSHINNSNAPVSTTGLWAMDAHGDSIVITTVGGSYLTYVYDGSTWYTHQEQDHTYDARIDMDGNFWICGIGFVEKFDGTSWNTYNIMNTGLTSMFNNDVFVDSRNRTWLSSSDNGGVSVFDCPNWQSYNPYNANLWPAPITYSGYGAGITEDGTGDIWYAISGVAGGVVQIPNGDISNPGAWTLWESTNAGVVLGFVNRIAGDQTGNVYAGYDNVCSISKYNRATNDWTNFNLFQLGQITCGAGSGIESIRVDDSNNVWVCGLAGLAKYDQTNWTFYSYLNTPMQQGFVYDIDFDSLGNKWIATEKGLFKFSGTTWTKYDQTNTPFAGDVVKAVLVDDNGIVWAGAGNAIYPYPGGLYSFDGSAWTSYTTANSGLPEKYINRLAKDTLGNLMVLTEGHGLAVFNSGGVVGYECIDRTLSNCLNTGISTLDDPELDLFTAIPNPVHNDITTVKFKMNSSVETVSITLSDVTGKVVKSYNRTCAGTEYQQLDIGLSGLKDGLYFCTLRTPEFNKTIKLVKN